MNCGDAAPLDPRVCSPLARRGILCPGIVEFSNRQGLADQHCPWPEVQLADEHCNSRSADSCLSLRVVLTRKGPCGQPIGVRE